VTVTVDVAPNARRPSQQHPGRQLHQRAGIPGNNDANATLTVSSSADRFEGVLDRQRPALTPVTVTLSFTNGSATAMTTERSWTGCRSHRFRS